MARKTSIRFDQGHLGFVLTIEVRATVGLRCTISSAKYIAAMDLEKKRTLVCQEGRAIY